MYEVKIIADSLAPCGKRLTTITATYPRFIHSEILTHRDRERNSASSRAIPFPVMCERIVNEPVVPLAWLSEKPGMQGGNEIPEALRPLAKAIWLRARTSAVRHAQNLHNIESTAQLILSSKEEAQKYLPMMSPDEVASLSMYLADRSVGSDSSVKIHKSLPNRIVEPWMWMTVVMSATEWKNFFRLRCHPDAEQHFQKIAAMIREALAESNPTLRDSNERCAKWHLPFVGGNDWDDARTLSLQENGTYDVEFAMELLCRLSTARCARVSYLTHEGKRDIEKDLDLFDKLANGSGFGHWSPHGHVAQAADTLVRSGPFIGWNQFRKQFPLENEEG